MRRTARTTALLTGALALTGTLALTGCGSDNGSGGSGGSDGSGGGSGSGGPELSVSAAYMPQPVSDSMAAGFLTVSNEGGEKAELVSVTSDIGEVTVHETVGSSMREVDSLAVPAGGKLELSSGGNHLMFENLKRKPLEGEKVTVKLHFADGSPVDVEIPVKAATYRPTAGR
ncbi:copper chaperone PCu(A)C [Streptomyces sp. NPDC091377]|uniref:copper chaperone PCu(A)C n=1 Tax=Streptomyces sp. NPDC091377 TaxID=3365995 RepID=UPI003824B0C6